MGISPLRLAFLKLLPNWSPGILIQHCVETLKSFSQNGAGFQKIEGRRKSDLLLSGGSRPDRATGKSAGFRPEERSDLEPLRRCSGDFPEMNPPGGSLREDSLCFRC